MTKGSGLVIKVSNFLLSKALGEELIMESPAYDETHYRLLIEASGISDYGVTPGKLESVVNIIMPYVKEYFQLGIEQRKAEFRKAIENFPNDPKQYFKCMDINEFNSKYSRTNLDLVLNKIIENKTYAKSVMGILGGTVYLAYMEGYNGVNIPLEVELTKEHFNKLISL